MEIDPIGWKDSGASVCRLGGVYVEGSVFLNNPFVVLAGERSFGRAVHNRDLKIAGIREHQRDGGG